ncbi:hypothetical protein AWM79_20555 [Pseudomonas agarici]|uniref:DUF4381 domain-containing protein n=1 Tax=Pseudomonas agarici TaxID=46677 RepID=A0A0X1T603_PSEAA|nr:DUF4381 domain-containing protein [Pseudomonas agarici]AMB87554.1 hypothetical protein AWM79_20555 [Pseudomonas agarici]NWB90046.1 DUF4381 domain-containing protein [Pseudomonas agarici]NWC08176.1 DUF4381 domain-containing protein [Pseudomonas agarici]SEK84799.1 protein of unknown function [Pseudomonas agarici]
MSGLDSLQPLISPPVQGFWPPAPGWWLLALLLPLLGVGLGYLRRWLVGKRPLALAEQPLDPLRLAALDELARLPKPYDGAPAGAWLQQLNALLKRLCRNDYPYSQSHTLNGRQWLAFLDNRCPAAGLTRWMVLVEGAYKPECKLDDKAIAGLSQSIDTWIRKHV